MTASTVARVDEDVEIINQQQPRQSPPQPQVFNYNPPTPSPAVPQWPSFFPSRNGRCGFNGLPPGPPPGSPTDQQPQFPPGQFPPRQFPPGQFPTNPGNATQQNFYAPDFQGRRMRPPPPYGMPLPQYPNYNPYQPPQGNNNSSMQNSQQPNNYWPRMPFNQGYPPPYPVYNPMNNNSTNQQYPQYPSYPQPPYGNPQYGQPRQFGPSNTNNAPVIRNYPMYPPMNVPQYPPPQYPMSNQIPGRGPERDNYPYLPSNITKSYQVTMTSPPQTTVEPTTVAAA